MKRGTSNRRLTDHCCKGFHRSEVIGQGHSEVKCSLPAEAYIMTAAF